VARKSLVQALGMLASRGCLTLSNEMLDVILVRVILL